jgi:hypothetical protein
LCCLLDRRRPVASGHSEPLNCMAMIEPDLA